MTSNQKLLLAALAAPFVGALLFLLTAERGEEPGEVVPTVVDEDQPAPLAELTVPETLEEPDSKAAAFMEARWGHLQDAGAASPQMSADGDMVFVVPRIFRGRDGQGRPIYARALAKPRRLGNVVRGSQVTRTSTPQVPLREWDSAKTLELQRTLGPIDDPNDLPEELQQEHPLHPDYDGPGSN